MGPSGSGKSTLLHILGLLEIVDQGEYLFNDVNLINLKDQLDYSYSGRLNLRYYPLREPVRGLALLLH